jgi:hypothetical protein
LPTARLPVIGLIPFFRLDRFAAFFGEEGGDDDDVGRLFEGADRAVHHDDVGAAAVEAVNLAVIGAVDGALAVGG